MHKSDKTQSVNSELLSSFNVFLIEILPFISTDPAPFSPKKNHDFSLPLSEGKIVAVLFPGKV
jgi:hypothetical protein